MKKTLKCLLSVLCAFALLLSGLAVYADEPADAVEAPAADAAANSSEEVKEDYPTKSVGGSYSPTLKNAEKTFRLAVRSSTHVTLIAEGSLAVRISVCEEETGSKVKGAESDNAEKPLILSFNAEAKNYLITAKALNGTSGKLRIQILDDEKYASWVKEREAAKEEKEAPAEEPEAVENAPAEEEPAAEPEIVEEAPAAEPEVVEEAPAAEPEVVEEEPAAEPEVVEEAPVEEAPADEVEDEITIVDPESEPEEETETPAETASKTVYKFSDANISAVVTLSKASVIPDDAKLKVTHIQPGSRAYKAYMEALNKNGSMEYDASNSLIYDFAFLVDGIEVQAEDGTMKVDVTFKQNQLTELGAESAKDVSVKHLTLDEDVLDKVDRTVQADFTADDVHISSVGTSVSLDGNTDQVGFTVDGFSAFVFTTTTNAKPTITTQPSSVSIKVGQSATLKVVASGTGLKYQWYYRTSSSGSWKKIQNNGTSSTRSVTGAADINKRQYRCVVSNSSGSVTSSIATVTIIPAITTQPASVSVKDGETVTTKVVATGAGLTYQWQYKDASATSWSDVSSASGKTASRTVTMKTALNGRQYRCVITDANGKKLTSSAMKLVLFSITKNLPAETEDIKAGTKITIGVTATGLGLKYQWQYKDAKTTSWTDVTGDSGKTASRSMSPVANLNGRQYRCIVKDNNGHSATSAAVKLKIYDEDTQFRFRLMNHKSVSIIKYIGTKTSVTVPTKIRKLKVTQINSNSFKGTSIKSIVLPVYVNYIGASAFENCKSLTTVTLPDIVATIGKAAFKNCTKLTTMKIQN